MLYSDAEKTIVRLYSNKTLRCLCPVRRFGNNTTFYPILTHRVRRFDLWTLGACGDTCGRTGQTRSLSSTSAAWTSWYA
eukprot:1895604-Rhodomonas_salina.3